MGIVANFSTALNRTFPAHIHPMYVTRSHKSIFHVCVTGPLGAKAVWLQCHAKNFHEALDPLATAKIFDNRMVINTNMLLYVSSAVL